ncbi:DUF4189 domain-containing protein [Methylorubrum extorquens]|uniref:DUF4189 domain-containing protein n=1 Tax=Methylorubrum extorquens TaxID=408 RepID=A0AAX3WIA2_METEX|nr:DUF4189 domain-containing protein [Methylorubrum extorquens]
MACVRRSCTKIPYTAPSAAYLTSNLFNARVSAGAGFSHQSKDEAIENALEQCSISQIRCEIIVTFSSGCAYVTTGQSSTNAGFGAGKSVADAYNRCSSQGITCNPSPIGGCVD